MTTKFDPKVLLTNNVYALKNYCDSLTSYSRYKTREVMVGSVGIGGNNPIRIQSMTTTDTMDTKATVEQSIRMIEAGCELVRITAPSIKEAKNLEVIKKELRAAGFDTPLIADIHFTPNAAEMAARLIEKVRVNPGNYIDRKRFDFIEYDDTTYQAEIDRIRERFTPLVKICKEYGTAMRIGTNHGSLSDRIMSRFGDTPLGMVESALEFVRICRDENYHNIVLSMKASNTQVMVEAYRLLVSKMTEEGMDYPLHLGVTEAGGGEDGRVKSALGIGALLEDGLGDTIRVSLTEDPEFEAPVAIALADRYKNRSGHAEIPAIETNPLDPFNYNRRESFQLLNIGGSSVPVVVTDLSQEDLSDPASLAPVGYFYDEPTDKWNMNDTACDYFYLGENLPGFDLPHGSRGIYDYSFWKKLDSKERALPLLAKAEYLEENDPELLFKCLSISLPELDENTIAKLKDDAYTIILLRTDNTHGMAEQRRFFFRLIEEGIKNPVILQRDYTGISEENFLLWPSTDFGGLLIDGFGDGVFVTLNRSKNATGNENPTLHTKPHTPNPLTTHHSPLTTETVNRILFGILQAARVRTSKTEYIACPSCGRTLFDLQETTEMIRKRTSHLKGVKIAIMGCIVNGPGEMADADYGYVGSGPGKITLYRGKEVVTKAIATEFAVDKLIDLIREDGNWVEPIGI
ncbi:MAG: 4-hydroxy-3-methylbut-2-en-1-yl diphosphate synthase (flavodoxin) [Ignavibacteriaceae bacterium]|nr:MAG: 4-hydroxy-3-methylbut-2-en-1-yl diphosphate synthase [Chlorobiota bacterium]GJQ33341.1 MAG: 4-hydroxy-3-methylbut-2-en-1-yl diphosphate synthase (flavodoxin) [Ignavibacteriaceae bacterium]